MAQNDTLCKACGKAVPQLSTGRRRLHCDTRCKQAALRLRRKAEAILPEAILPDDMIDLDQIPIAQLRAEASIRGLSMDGDRESLIKRILRHDGVEVVADAPIEVIAYQPKESPAPSRTAPRPKPRLRFHIRQAW